MIRARTFYHSGSKSVDKELRCTTIIKLADAGVQVYQMDQDGTIVATSDGDTIKLEKKGIVPAISTGSLMIDHLGQLVN